MFRVTAEVDIMKSGVNQDYKNKQRGRLQVLVRFLHSPFPGH